SARKDARQKIECEGWMRCKDGQNNQADDPEQNQLPKCHRPLVAAGVSDALRTRYASTPNDCHGSVHSCRHRAVAITCLNSRNDHLVDDAKCNCIWNHGFEAIAHFKPKFPVSRHDKQDEPVIDPFPPYLPFGECSHRPIFDRCAACRLADIDDELMTC